MPQNSNPHYDSTHRFTWLMRTASMLGAATLGVIEGAAAGLLLSFVPPLLQALNVPGAGAATLSVLPTMAIFAGVGAFLGATLGAGVGENAASVAAGLKQQERAEGRTPAAQPPVPETVPSKPQFFSWKVAAFTVPLTAAFGALISFAPPVSGAATLWLGLSGPAATVASAAAMGTLGLALGIKNAMLSNHMANIYADLLADNYFVKPQESTAPAQSPAIAAPEPARGEEPSPVITVRGERVCWEKLVASVKPEENPALHR